MTLVDLTFLALFAVVAGAFAVLVLLTDGRRSGAPKASPTQYGSGAHHAHESLPPISRAVTSAPMGSGEASAWPNSNAVPNRRPR